MNLPQIGDVRLAFATLFLQRHLSEMMQHNDSLTELARTLRGAPGAVGGSNSGGWQSDKTVFDRKDPAVLALVQHITTAIRDVSVMPPTQPAAPRLRVRMNGWVNMIGNGDYNTPHFHAGSTWSGVYYVRAGVAISQSKHINNGAIEFLDPRAACEMNFGSQSHAQRIVVPPRDGLLLLFPGYLGHFVHPYNGSGERISIAFNCIIGDAQADH